MSYFAHMSAVPLLLSLTPDWSILPTQQPKISFWMLHHLPDLAALLGIPVEEIEHIAVKPEPGLSAKTKYIQVAGLGRLGQQRGKHQERQTAAITKALQEKHKGRIRKIAFKKFSSGNDLQWFVESRGANDAEKDEALILEGVPTPNIEALAAEFTCLYGRVPEPGTIKVKYNIKVTNSNLGAVQK